MIGNSDSNQWKPLHFNVRSVSVGGVHDRRRAARPVRCPGTISLAEAGLLERSTYHTE